MKSAWLVTWEWLGNHAKKEEKIVSILNYRYSLERVKKYIEQCYIDSEYLLVDKLSCAKSANNNPYQAESSSGDKITCGHNPFLFARIVHNVKIEKDINDNETLVWEEG